MVYALTENSVTVNAYAIAGTVVIIVNVVALVSSVLVFLMGFVMKRSPSVHVLLDTLEKRVTLCAQPPET